MAPGVNGGTVYVSTVPGNSKGFYKGNGQAILWALNAKSGAAKWKWEEVPKDLWSESSRTSTRAAASGIRPPSTPTATSTSASPTRRRSRARRRPVRLGPPWPEPLHRLHREAQQGHGQARVALPADPARHQRLGPAELAHPDEANGKDVVIAAGKAGIVVAVDQATGKLLWKTPVGIHNGHDNDGLLRSRRPRPKLKPPSRSSRASSAASSRRSRRDGTNVYAAVINLA